MKKYEIEGAGQSAVMQSTGAYCNVYNHWDHGRWYELPLLKYWQSLIPPDIFVDVGAHVGNHTVWGAKAWPRARVIAFEPDRTIFRRLVQNTIRNGAQHVDCRNAGAWSRRGQGFLDVYGEDEGMRRVRDMAAAGTPVHLETVDDAVRNGYQAAPEGRRIIIKIDAESENTPILHGMANTLRQNHCRLFIEAGDETSLKLTGRTLAAMGYSWTGQVWGRTPMYEALKA